MRTGRGPIMGNMNCLNRRLSLQSYDRDGIRYRSDQTVFQRVKGRLDTVVRLRVMSPVTDKVIAVRNSVWDQVREDLKDE